MTVFNLEAKEYWFDVKGGGRICLRPLTVEDWREIEKATTKKKEVFKPYQGQIVRVAWQEPDDDKQNEMFWDKVIVDWENFFDANGKPIPCTKKNKVLLIMKSSAFLKFLTDCIQKMNEEEEKRQEEIEKNS